MTQYLSRALAIFMGSAGSFACGGAPVEVDRDPAQFLQTSNLRFEVSQRGDGYEVAIPFVYQNRSGRTIHVIHCATRMAGDRERVALDMLLEKETEVGWDTVWSAAVPLCFSPPIVIAPGQEYADTLVAVGAPKGARAYPQWLCANCTGVYRLSWRDLYFIYDKEKHVWGDAVPEAMSRSNLFVLRFPNP